MRPWADRRESTEKKAGKSSAEGQEPDEGKAGGKRKIKSSQTY